MAASCVKNLNFYLTNIFLERITVIYNYSVRIDNCHGVAKFNSLVSWKSTINLVKNLKICLKTIYLDWWYFFLELRVFVKWIARNSYLRLVVSIDVVLAVVIEGGGLLLGVLEGLRGGELGSLGLEVTSGRNSPVT